jgi:UV DNA damage endonuclease
MRLNTMEKNKKTRLGLCCIFCEEPIKFRQTTAKRLLTFSRKEQLKLLSEICLHNAKSLQVALQYVAKVKIGAFRILSPLFPRYTHPKVGYTIEDLPDGKQILNVFDKIRDFRKVNDIRLSFHPDQFNVLSSPRKEVVVKTIRELEYHGTLADLTDADVINIHGGGGYGNKVEALERFKENLKSLSPAVLRRLTVENDDVTYSPNDLLPLCEDTNIPMVYDIHHHRCFPDGLSEKDVTNRVVCLWEKAGREPYFHLSSAKNKSDEGSSRPHADYITKEDFPSFWRGLKATIDIEAKSKELAVLKLQKELGL